LQFFDDFLAEAGALFFPAGVFFADALPLVGRLGVATAGSGVEAAGVISPSPDGAATGWFFVFLGTVDQSRFQHGISGGKVVCKGNFANELHVAR
jgi:hypothetical protein